MWWYCQDTTWFQNVSRPKKFRGTRNRQDSCRQRSVDRYLTADLLWEIDSLRPDGTKRRPRAGYFRY